MSMTLVSSSLLGHLQILIAGIAVLESIRKVAQKVAYKMMQFYPGNQTGMIPGLFGDPYYWWEAGGAFGVCLVPYGLFVSPFSPRINRA
jgi:hypothetical protein